MAKRFVFFRLFVIVLFWKFDVLRAEFWPGARLGTNNNTGQSLCVIFCRDITGDDNDTLREDVTLERFSLGTFASFVMESLMTSSKFY